MQINSKWHTFLAIVLVIAFAVPVAVSATGVGVTDARPSRVTYTGDNGAGGALSDADAWTMGGLVSGAVTSLNGASIYNGNDYYGAVGDIAKSEGVAAFSNPAGNAAGSAVSLLLTLDLCATTGTVTPTVGVVIPIWGYTLGDCTSGLPAQIPGPTIVANQGDDINLTLHNNLTETTALLFQGQALPPDLVGVAAGASATYSFEATDAGTYLYEAGILPNAQHQAAMGMYGALIVRPPTPGRAYEDPATVYDDEALLLLSEIDPVLNNSATPSAFDMRNYSPKYWLINGRAYPNTTSIPTSAGNIVLLRYVNAGLQKHSMAVLGLRQSFIAIDGNLLNFSRRMVAETIAPGQTADVITTVPVSAALGSKFALHDGNLMLHNNSAAGFGGMLTFLMAGVAPPPGVDSLGPSTSAVALVPNPTGRSAPVLLSATVSDVFTGGSNITAAEYFIDTIGVNGSGVAMTGVYDVSPTTAVAATISGATVSAMSVGNHIIYVHARDAMGNWGLVGSAVLRIEYKSYLPLVFKGP